MKFIKSIKDVEISEKTGNYRPVFEKLKKEVKVYA